MGAKLAGGGGGSKHSAPANSEPNVIPFIDIMLVLLIIFMVASPMPTVDIKVDLPPPNAVATPQLERRDPTFVDVLPSPAGLQILVDGVEVTFDTLEDRVFSQAQINNPGLPAQNIYAEARIFVRVPDQDIAYANVVSVMSFLQERNYAKVGIFAQRTTAF